MIIPIKDESNSLETLIVSIKQQRLQPAEVILVDGGSTDNTLELAEQLVGGDDKFKVIKVAKASPGKGRNIGTAAAQFEWVAFTDAGIKLENDWLEKLVEPLKNDSELEVIYGNFSPIIDTFFEKCGVFAYVPPQKKAGIRSKFIASSLMKKAVWEKVGGFPDFRAAEDLIFMENLEKQHFKTGYAPQAMAYWHLRPDLLSTFQKFVLYSKHNIWANRQWDWHYGIAKYYLALIPVLLLTIFYSWWWLLGFVLWLILRTIKRIAMHRYKFGLGIIFNPFVFIGVAFLILTIDTATFVGWAQALLHGEK